MEPVNYRDAQFGLYVLTTEVTPEGQGVAAFAGYFLTREDLERYQREFDETPTIVVEKIDGYWNLDELGLGPYEDEDGKPYGF